MRRILGPDITADSSAFGILISVTLRKDAGEQPAVVLEPRHLMELIRFAIETNMVRLAGVEDICRERRAAL